MRILSVILVISFLSGCQSSLEYPYSAAKTEQLTAEVISARTFHDKPLPDVLYLDEQTRAALDQRIQKSWTPQRRLNELREFLFAADELNIRYDASSTRTAQETFQTRSGNCLSLTNLFIATARHVGLPARYETVDVKPTWNHENQTLIRYEHIVATGSIAGFNKYVVDFLPEFVLGDYESKPTSDLMGLALYFNNLGAEHLVDGKQVQAIEYLQQALRLNPESTDAWNNIGAAYRRNNQLDLAEFSYHQALSIDRFNYSALSNLATLYQVQNRIPEARKVEQAVNNYRRHNPYFHYFLATLLFERGRYHESLLLLEESTRLKKDEPDFYLAMAKNYAQLGDSRSEQRMQKLARSYESDYVPPPRQNSHRFFGDMIEIKY